MGGGWEKKIMTEIVATNIIVSGQPEWGSSASAKHLLSKNWCYGLWTQFGWFHYIIPLKTKMECPIKKKISPLISKLLNLEPNKILNFEFELEILAFENWTSWGCQN